MASDESIQGRIHVIRGQDARRAAAEESARLEAARAASERSRRAAEIRAFLPRFAVWAGVQAVPFDFNTRWKAPAREVDLRSWYGRNIARKPLEGNTTTIPARAGGSAGWVIHELNNVHEDVKGGGGTTSSWVATLGVNSEGVIGVEESERYSFDQKGMVFADDFADEVLGRFSLDKVHQRIAKICVEKNIDWQG